MIRHIQNAWHASVVAVACATLGCAQQSSVESPSAPGSTDSAAAAAGGASAAEIGPSGTAASAGGGESGSGTLSDCDCGPLMPRPPSDCPSDRWFCNRENSCGCDGATGAAATNVASARRAAPSSAPRPDSLAQSAGQGGANGAGQGGAPGCMCTGASVSPPQGGCPLANWFCNASGLCRCRL